MQINIHRGTNQIGGCITEIITDTTRIFIDMGDNLPGIGTPMSAEEKHNYVATLFAENQRKHQAVFYTHGHTDHVGLLKYVPNEVAQYMSEGTKQLLVFKQEVLKEARKKQLKNSSTTTDEPIEYDEQLAKQIKASITWQRPKPHKAPKSIQIGDIRITPYFVSHSIYDASMLLIEADNKRILHMGDYREHSTLGKGLIPTLKTYIKQVDILITEGTMLTQPEFVGRTEEQISQRMADVMRAFKHVFVLTSATDYERLQSISNAAYTASLTCLNLPKDLQEKIVPDNKQLDWITAK